ncbi:(2Fe-2S)-binding protein [Geofilum rhodophaeum]|uniref:(2Fe-2S)-binding protein n=1 Tax=Geofilum rhodophaeum TaxID=1965019 RepID=UPI000B524C4E|nr:(2Fe-2S)-binding protein [Geofilum rhodophaeum]
MSPSFVCNCNGVTEQKLIAAIAQRKITDLSKLMLRTGAGMSCGRCKPALKVILERNKVVDPNPQQEIDWDQAGKPPSPAS